MVESLLLIITITEWTTRKITKSPGGKVEKDFWRSMCKQFSSEEKIRIVLDGMRGEESNAELCSSARMYKRSLATCLQCPRCPQTTTRLHHILFRSCSDGRL